MGVSEVFLVKRRIAFILLVIMSLWVISVHLTWAKFKVETVSRDLARAAGFSVITSAENKMLILSENEEKAFHFTVNNGEKASEVSIEYDVVIYIPTKLTVYKTLEIKLFINGIAKESFDIEQLDETIQYTYKCVGFFEAGINSSDDCEIRFAIKDADVYDVYKINVYVVARQKNGGE